MATRIHMVPGGHPAPPATARKFNFDRPLVIGAALALWAAILVVLKLVSI